MKRYSVFAVAREAARYHSGWERAWKKATPKKKYDVIIVGAGGHGLATAYYLGKNFGITNVAVLEKGWLGGGNTGRNTTIIRSNYLQDPSAAIYEKSRSLYETLSQDLNYNVMFSPRGVMMLAQTHHEVRGYERTAHANKLQGVTTEFIGPEKVKQLVPIINIHGPRYPVLGRHPKNKFNVNCYQYLIPFVPQRNVRVQKCGPSRVAQRCTRGDAASG